MKKQILAKSKWPKILKHPKVKGICIGKCIYDYNPFALRQDGKRTLGHAHIYVGLKKGWLCFMNHQVLSTKYIQIHELAHLITGEAHNDKWRKKVLELGGTLEERAYQRSYIKKKKSKKKKSKR